MFGHDDKKQDDQDYAHQNEQVAPTDNPSPQPADPIATPTLSSDSGTQSSDDSWQDAVSPAGGFPTPASQKSHVAMTSPDEPASDAVSDKDDEIVNVENNDLVVIKQQALTELFPLVDKLDQTPDERFRTLMMMIQASDNQGLIKSAYEAAHKIADEKTKAQALLDVVNEINYFTHQPES